MRKHGRETIQKAGSLFRSSHEAVTQIVEAGEEAVTGVKGPLTDAARQAEATAKEVERNLKGGTVAPIVSDISCIGDAAKAAITAGVRPVDDHTAARVVADARPPQTTAAQIG